MATALLIGSGHQYRDQDEVSLSDWGDFRGWTLAEMCRLFQPPETIRTIIETADAVMDDGQTRWYDLPSRGGTGRTTLVRVGGLLLTRWDWLAAPVIEPGPPDVALSVRLSLMAEHLDRLAWALREGRDLPHVPAALLRAARRPPSSSAPDPTGPRSDR